MSEYAQESGFAQEGGDNESSGSHSSAVKKAVADHRKGHVPHITTHSSDHTSPSQAKGGFNGPGGTVAGS